MTDREQSPPEQHPSALPSPSAPARAWRVKGREIVLGRRPLVMGIVNVTPDSFSDGGQFAATDAAVAHALTLVEQGADLLDVGGESTRPGATPVPRDEECRRVVPVVEALARRVAVPISVDTSKAAVARACLAVGAHIVNDVTALGGDPEMPEVVRSSGAGAVLMHMQGTPQTMQDDPRYADVTADVLRFLEARVRELIAAGLEREHLAVDPGIGFGKTYEHNMRLLSRLIEFQRLGLPVCLGVSRKGFISKALGGGRDAAHRMAGSVAVACQAACRGSAQVIRVHDVAETSDAVRLLAAIDDMGPP